MRGAAVALVAVVTAVGAPYARMTIDAPTIRVGLARSGAGYAIETMALETYVARVLAGEAARDSGAAALDALAITVRTFALANRGRHRGEGFDLCDQTHCQVVRTATPTTEASAVRTAGRVLLDGGSPASIYYTASCGGRSEVPSAVWPGAVDPPFLVSQRDAACGGGPTWSAELTEGDLLRALRAAGFAGDRLRGVRIASHDVSGRVARLTLDGMTPSEISGQDLRVAVGRTLGWQRIKSTAFDLTRVSHAYRFDGHGSGHGVGLCVIGSVQLAADGESAEKILHKYFPGLRIGAAVETVASAPAAARRIAAHEEGVVLSLPDEDEGDRPTLAARIAAARDELARTLGVAPPAQILVRVHATTDAYEQASGRPWFTFGAAVGRELHLLPLGALRERGVLERTIRRGLVHTMIDSDLAGRPLWVREGFAIYFAEPREARPVQGRVACPEDRDLQQPVSMGALAAAYASARGCVARQLASGRNWREVR
jgi:stage II sporulation protein D